ncbi:MAG: ABC transporter substrate-binding protein [Lactobacillales bacterium]|nr:ABC transporter substrate-binding protein [Lactobacillales bacterium]
MKKILIGAGVVLIIVLSLFIFESRYFESRQKAKQERVQKPVVKIGVIMPLTGNLSTWGKAHNNGIILAYENLSKNTKFTYKLVIEDSGDGISTLPGIVSKMLNVDKVDAFISIFDPNANVISPIITKAKKIHVGESWFPTFIGNKYNFNVYSSIRAESRLIADQVKRDGYKNIVLFTAVHSGFINGTHLLKDELAAKDIKICKEISFNMGERDFRTSISQVKRECTPDFYIIGAFPPESDILIKQINEISGNRMPITGLDLGVNGSLYGLYEGYWFPAPAKPAATFVTEYMNRFHSDDYWYGGGIGYSVLNVLVDAYENARADTVIPTSDEISDYIHTSGPFESVFGELTVQPSGQVDIPVEKLIIKNGVPIKAE